MVAIITVFVIATAVAAHYVNNNETAEEFAYDMR